MGGNVTLAVDDAHAFCSPRQILSLALVSAFQRSPLHVVAYCSMYGYLFKVILLDDPLRVCTNRHHALCHRSCPPTIPLDAQIPNHATHASASHLRPAHAQDRSVD